MRRLAVGASAQHAVVSFPCMDVEDRDLAALSRSFIEISIKLSAAGPCRDPSALIQVGGAVGGMSGKSSLMQTLVATKVAQEPRRRCRSRSNWQCQCPHAALLLFKT
jgi:hypothetical protein